MPFVHGTVVPLEKGWRVHVRMYVVNNLSHAFRCITAVVSDADVLSCTAVQVSYIIMYCRHVYMYVRLSTAVPTGRSIRRMYQYLFR